MALPTTCPSQKQLSEYIVGKIHDGLAEEIGEHLHQCSQCIQALARLDVQDPLSEVLQRPDLMEMDADPKYLAKLEKRLHLALQTQSAGNPPTVSDESPESVTPSSVSSDPRGDTQELLDFLEPSDQPGELGRLGRYRVRKILGTGGMGVVLQAEDTRLGRLVALKVMKPSLARAPGIGARIVKEAARAALVKHDHIVTIHDVSKEQNVFYLAMELLEGNSLEQFLQAQGKPSLAELCRIGREIAEGLAAAHEAGLIHRDIKPSNIWLEGKRARVKILDFGLACKQQEESASSWQGALIGTPAYMAPEQAQGEKIDSRADLFGLGCVLYRLATGEMPFRGKDTLSLLVAIAESPATPPHKLNPALPVELSKLIMQMLNKAPSARPTAGEVAMALARIEQSLATAPAQMAVAAREGEPANDIEAELEATLWQSLTFASKESFGDIDGLLKYYAFSMNQLQTVHEETTAFLHMMCKTNLEFRSEGRVNEAARDQVLAEELMPMMAHCLLAPLPADEVFTAYVTDLPPEHAEAKLSQELRKKTRTFVQQFLQVCEKLVDQQLLGLIEWANSAACVLHFFRKVVIQAETGRKVVEGAKTSEVQGRLEKVSTARSEVIEGEHEVRRVRHEHHLYRAESTNIDRATTIIPLPFQPLVKAIPPWLRPQIRLVTGVQFRGKINESQLKKASWTQAEQLPAKEEFRTLCEPAITLGRYVFAGWGDAEIQGECQREELEVLQEQKSKRAHAAAEFIIQRAAFYLIIELIAAVILCTSLTYSPANSWLGLLIAAAGTWPVLEILRLGSTIRPIREPKVYYASGFVAGLAGAAVILLLAAGFVLPSLSMGCLGVMFLAVFVVSFRQAQTQCQR